MDKQNLIKAYLHEIKILQLAIGTYEKNIEMYMESSKFSNMYNDKMDISRRDRRKGRN